jgi:hypothetical protein
MEVMMMIGSYAGEIRDVRPHHALGLIERGEAIDPNAPIHAEVEATTPAAAVEAPKTAKPAKPAKVGV